MAFTGPPDFDGMADWPVLRRVLAGRWHEATDWYRRRKIAGLAAGHPHHLQAVHAVRELERELGRRVKPFELDFVLLPVRDDQIRPLRPGRYLVPQRLRDGPAGPSYCVSSCSPRLTALSDELLGRHGGSRRGRRSAVRLSLSE